MYKLPLIYTVCTYNKGRCAVHIDTEKSLMLSILSGIWRGHYNIDIIKKKPCLLKIIGVYFLIMLRNENIS